MLTNRSIICFGGEDWWYHHPHSKAHLMRKFACAGNKVIFVNSISMGLPGLAHKDLLPRIKRKLGSYSKLARQTEEGITVVSPASLPFFGTAAARAANNSPSATYYYHLGMALKGKGDKEGSRRALETALRLADKRPLAARPVKYRRRRRLTGPGGRPYHEGLPYQGPGPGR